MKKTTFAKRYKGERREGSFASKKKRVSLLIITPRINCYDS